MSAGLQPPVNHPGLAPGQFPGLPTIMTNARAFWSFNDASLGVDLHDDTGRGNDLVRNMLPAADAVIPFTMAANSIGTQTLTGRLSKWGKWNRLLTSAEKAALLTAEAYPFATTPSLQTALKAYYLLNEASASSSYADATGRGNTLAVTGVGTTVQVAGPLGTDFGTKFNGTNWLQRAITADLQTGNIPCTIAGWVYLDAKGVTQQFLFGQFDAGHILGSVLYFHDLNDRFQTDWSNGVDLYRNAVVVGDDFGSPATGTWYFMLAEYNPVSPVGVRRDEGNTLTQTINNAKPNVLSRIQQPARAASPKLGEAGQFQQNPDYVATNHSGWDLVGSRGFCSRAANADLRFGNNAKTVWGWVRFDDTATTQTVLGFYDVTGSVIDWVIQQSAGIFYFLIGNSAGGFTFVSVPFTDTINWHLFVAWFDKAGDGKIHLVIDNGTPATPATPGATPASNSLAFLMGAAHNGANYAQQLKGSLDAVGIADGAPTAADLAALWNNGAGRELP